MTKEQIKELIETLWNVNYYQRYEQIFSAGELIETLWNVNIMDEVKSMGYANELIETLWNVNTGTYPDIDKYALGINRNIVECKYNRRIACCR